MSKLGQKRSAPIQLDDVGTKLRARGYILRPTEKSQLLWTFSNLPRQIDTYCPYRKSSNDYKKEVCTKFQRGFYIIVFEKMNGSLSILTWI
jgi:hypothetical protein